MSIAYDTASSPTLGTGTLSWTHTPVGTPRGIVVHTSENAITSSQITGVTYGGVAMVEVANSPEVCSTGETGVCRSFFLGTGIPTGAQTVVVSVSGAAEKAARCFSVTAATDTEVVITDGMTALTDVVIVSLALGARDCYVSFSGFSGVGAAAATGHIVNHSGNSVHDFGATIGIFGNRTAISTGTVDCGYSLTGADESSVIGVAIAEALSIGPSRSVAEHLNYGSF